MTAGDNNDDDLKVVSYDKTGTARVWLEGELHTLKRPKWGAYRVYRDMMKDLAPADQRRVEITKTVEALPPEEQLVAVQELLDLTDHLGQQKAGVIALIFNGDESRVPPLPALSDHELPKDPDDWDVWLVADEKFLPELLDHWRNVPLRRGG